MDELVAFMNSDDWYFTKKGEALVERPFLFLMRRKLWKVYSCSCDLTEPSSCSHAQLLTGPKHDGNKILL